MLDISAGRPSAGVTVSLHRLYPGSRNAWEFLSRRSTDKNGRIRDFLPQPDSLHAGDYRLVFDVEKYESTGSNPKQSFFPEVTIQFRVEEAQVQVRKF
jgi:5-hydroxyisourate hydrolase